MFAFYVFVRDFFDYAEIYEIGYFGSVSWSIGCLDDSALSPRVLIDASNSRPLDSVSHELQNMLGIIVAASDKSVAQRFEKIDIILPLYIMLWRAICSRDGSEPVFYNYICDLNLIFSERCCLIIILAFILALYNFILALIRMSVPP